jgi:hypothetical protein
VTTYDFGTSDGLEFITMEYVSGQMLDQMVSAFCFEQALKYAIEIADALAPQARPESCIDLKPGNVIITRRIALRCWTSAWPNSASSPAADARLRTPFRAKRRIATRRSPGTRWPAK